MINNAKGLLFGLLCCLFLLTPFGVQAQDGWEKIGSNDLKGAREAFDAQLKTNPNDRNALVGIMFLSELQQNAFDYVPAARKLVAAQPEDRYFYLFIDMLLEEEGKLADKASYRPIIRGLKAYNEIDTLTKQRKFDQAKATMAPMGGLHKWSVIGPFDNLEGSAHIRPHAIEQDPFSPDKVYTDRTGADYKWLDYRWVGFRLRTSFTDRLPALDGGSVYYANTFVDVPNSGKLQLRMGRSSAIKVWVDDDLVFEDPDGSNYFYENDIIELDAAAGTHRVLIKSTTLPVPRGRENFLAFKDSDFYLSTGGYSSAGSSLYGNWSGNGLYGDAGFLMNFTDASGKPIEQAKTAPRGQYTPKKYSPKVQSHIFLKEFQNQVAQNPNSLPDLYLLCKAWLCEGTPIKGEEFFVKLYRQHPDQLFYKYLCAKMYAANGKEEKAYSVLGYKGGEKSPLFALEWARFKELDKNIGEARFELALKALKELSPSNLMVVEMWQNFWDQKKDDVSPKEYLERLSKMYPGQKSIFEDILKDEDDEEEEKSAKSEHDGEIKSAKDAKNALKRLKANFQRGLCFDLMDYYEEEKQTDNVLKMYDELINTDPRPYDYQQKAVFLEDKKRYDEALVAIDSLLGYEPFSSSGLTLKAQIYLAKGDTTQGVKLLRTAMRYPDASASYFGYGGGSARDELAKINEKRGLRSKVDAPTIKEMVDDPTWRNKYPDFMAVLPYYMEQVHLDNDNNVSITQRIILYIQTADGAREFTQLNTKEFGYNAEVTLIKKNGTQVVPKSGYGTSVFEGLEAGDIITIESYREDVLREEWGPYLGARITMGKYFPTHRQIFELVIPSDQKLQYKPIGFKHEPVITNANGETHFRWDMREVPPTKEEQGELNNYDATPNLLVSTMPDWSPIVDWYLQKTYRKTDITYEVKETLDSIIKPGMTDLEKVVAVYNNITKSINYSSVRFLQNNFIPKDPGETCAVGIGDCKDVATLMVTMLRALNIEAYYVLVNSQDRSFGPLLPDMDFDHVIVGYVINGKMEYADLTSDFVPYYVLPYLDQDGQGLLIKEGVKDYFFLPNGVIDPAKNTQRFDLKAKVNADGSVDLTADIQHGGVVGGYLRESLNPANSDEKKKQLEERYELPGISKLTFKSYALDKLDSIMPPLGLKFETTIKDFAQEVGDILILPIPTILQIEDPEILDAEKRDHALFVGYLVNPSPSIQDLAVTLPDGYTLRKLPEDVTVDGKFLQFKMRYSATANGFKLRRELRFYQDVIEPEDFAGFKAEMQQVVAADKKKAPLEKK
jgi:tetratricopeptide (TPR) repeat protein